MDVILLKDVKGLGKKDQTVKVSDGYANNFLLPRRLAVPSSKKSQEILGNQQENARLQDEKNHADAEALAEKLKTITLEFKNKVGKDGKCFGSTSLKQVEEALLNQYQITIDKRKFIDKGPLDMIGYYQLKIDLYKGVIGVVKVHISEENK